MSQNETVRFKSENVVTVIMGGGKGTRLFPLTDVRSKPAVPFGGKYRLIDITMSNCIHSNFKRIFLLTQFNSQSLNSHIKDSYHFDSFSSSFIDVIAAEQTPKSTDWFQGTADAVRKALPHILNHSCKYVLILAGDHLYRMDYRNFMDFHVSRHAPISIACRPVPASAAPQLGILKVNSRSRITDWVEKPDNPDVLKKFRMKDTGQYLASMGMYIFNRDVLLKCLEESEHEDFGKGIIPYAFSKYKVFGFPFKGYWQDIGTIAAFYRENMKFTNKKPAFNLYRPTRQIYTHARFLPPTNFNDCRIYESRVAEGGRLEQCEIINSILGIRAIVRSGTKIEKSYIMGNDYYEDGALRGKIALGIGSRTIIRKAIIDKNARIGTNVRILNEKKLRNHDSKTGNYYIRNGIVIIPKNAVIPDNTVI